MYIVGSRELTFGVGLQSTVFQAEIYAIKACVMGNVEKCYTGRNIYFLSYSQVANKCPDNAELVLDFHQSLVKLEEHNRIQLLCSCGGLVSVCQQVLVPTRYVMKTQKPPPPEQIFKNVWKNVFVWCILRIKCGTSHFTIWQDTVVSIYFLQLRCSLKLESVSYFCMVIAIS